MRSSGFTLLELLVAVALLAVLAVLSWRGMDALLTTRDRVVTASDDLRALSTGFAQIGQDLRATRIVSSLVPDEAPIVVQSPASSSGPELLLLRYTGTRSASQAGTFPLQRVQYRLLDGRLERGFSPWIPGTDGSFGTSAAAVPIWQPLIDEVDEIGVRLWVAGRGWVSFSGPRSRPGGVPIPAGPSIPDSSGGGAAPVDGVELTLVRRGRSVVRVFAARD